MANGPAADRETRDLLAGGIGPGHPSLYPAPEASDDTPTGCHVSDMLLVGAGLIALMAGIRSAWSP